MFNAIALGIVLLDGWGMIGIWTDKFGFHHVWEVWVRILFISLFIKISNYGGIAEFHRGTTLTLLSRSIKLSMAFSYARGIVIRKL